MNYLVLAFAKMAGKILHLMGRGTAFPGDFALKYNKDILKYFKMPEKVIFVTGTSGKTSVANTICEVYQNAGYKACCNAKGSNLLGGITTAIINSSKLNGKSKVDVLILEVDERYVKVVSRYITPTYLLVTNLSRDQLARNGHYKLVFDEINNSIKDKTTLILNGDDPLVSQFKLNGKNKKVFYSLSKNMYSTSKNKMNTLDVAYCPICNSKLEFKYFNYGNLGKYTCPLKDFTHPKCLCEAKLEKNEIIIGKDKIKLHNDMLFNVYNILSVYTLALFDGLEGNKIAKSLSDPHVQSKRMASFKYNGINTTFMLSKNETPITYNQSFEFIEREKGAKTVAIGFTRISGRYNKMDISWIYDIDFEALNNDDIKKIILVGPYAYDLASRLKLAGVDMKKVVYLFDVEDSFDKIYENTPKKTHLYTVVYFDLFYKYKDIYKKRGVNI